ncbi:hypothetical protein DL98DRAFT_441263 [Cadophora sp. DSE1049]|nr:hypothetical protein DL98DRAFT_441263 [Cadophora sp. DSE1049]
MILQSLKSYNRFNSPIIYFTAVLGIVENENRLKRSNKYLYILAGFIYYVRVLFVKYTLPAATRAEQTAEDIDRFFKLRKKYLVVRSYSLCSFLIKMLGYSKTISIQKINQPSIT